MIHELREECLSRQLRSYSSLVVASLAIATLSGCRRGEGTEKEAVADQAAAWKQRYNCRAMEESGRTYTYCEGHCDGEQPDPLLCGGPTDFAVFELDGGRCRVQWSFVELLNPKRVDAFWDHIENVGFAPEGKYPSAHGGRPKLQFKKGAGEETETVTIGETFPGEDPVAQSILFTYSASVDCGKAVSSARSLFEGAL